MNVFYPTFLNVFYFYYVFLRFLTFFLFFLRVFYIYDWNHHTATPCGITQYYLLHGSANFPAFTLSEAGTRFSDPGGMQGWVDLGGGYMPRWFTRETRSPVWKWDMENDEFTEKKRKKCERLQMLKATEPITIIQYIICSYMVYAVMWTKPMAPRLRPIANDLHHSV